MTGPPAVQTPGPSPTPISQMVVRSDVQTTFVSVASTADLITLAGGSSTTENFGRHVVAAMHHRTIASMGSCVDSEIQTTTYPSATSATVTDQYFYDAACTEPWKTITATVNTATGTATGSETVYSLSGAVTEYLTLALMVSEVGSTENVTIEVTLAANTTATPTSSVGISCSLTGATAKCGSAAVETLTSVQTMLGAALTFSGTLSAAAGGNESVALTETASAYSGATGTLSIAQGAGTAWSIVGGSLLDTLNVSGTGTYSSSGTVVALSLGASDAANGDSITMTGSASGITGTVTQNGTALATFTLDGSGNGTISYANGTTETVTGYTLT
jgi:hypothetical protein